MLGQQALQVVLRQHLGVAAELLEGQLTDRLDALQRVGRRGANLGVQSGNVDLKGTTGARPGNT